MVGAGDIAPSDGSGDKARNPLVRSHCSFDGISKTSCSRLKSLSGYQL